MGASNVAAAFTHWSRPLARHDRGMRLLVYMALITQDADALPRWWGGQDPLAEALGRNPNGLPLERQAALEAVRAALQTLRRVGAICEAERGRNGKRAEYLLHLSSPHATGTTCGKQQAHPVVADRTILRKPQDHPAEATGLAYPKEYRTYKKHQRSHRPWRCHLTRTTTNRDPMSANTVNRTASP